MARPLHHRALETARMIGPRPALLLYEAAHRVSRPLRARALRRRYPGLATQSPGSPVSWLPRVALPVAADLPSELEAAASRLREEAEAALLHEFDLLGSGPVELGDRIPWHLDFKSGYRWPALFFMDVEVTRLGDASDAKVPWELSRCHHFLTLARAARVFGEDSYAGELRAQWCDWIDANPVGVGINWANPMEVALRATNWVWALGTMEATPFLTPGERTRVERALYAHGVHVAHTLEGSPRLRSNHYLGDLLGLLAVGAAFAGDSGADRWSARARAGFEREVRAQVLDDGISFEASTGYHALAAEIFLVAASIAASAGRPLSDRFLARVSQMADASEALRHPDGRMPMFGDWDDGRVLPASDRRDPRHDHVLWGAGVILGREVPPESGDGADAAWAFGLDSWRGVPRGAGESGSAAFPQGGLFVIRNGPAQVVVRCGGVGQNGNGGHAHNDVLAYELSFGGRLAVADPGSYVYTADPQARNAFRSTAAHNTVMVDDEEINPIERSELFRLRQVASPQVDEWAVGGEVRFRGSHDGYRRLAAGIVHSRTVTAGADGAVEVVDRLDGRGHARGVLRLQFAPRARVEPAGTDWRVSLDGGDTLRLAADLPGGGSEVRDGAVAERYGVATAAPALWLSAAGPCPLVMTHRFTPAVA